jgi:hypothetical protein
MVCWQAGTGQEYTLPLETFELSFAVRRLIALEVAGYVQEECLELQNQR